MNDQENILVDYLEGQLNAERTMEVERLLAARADLREQLEALKLSRDAIAYAHDRTLKQRLTEWQEDSTRTANPARTVRMPARWIAMAASFLILAIVGTQFYQQTQRPAQLFASYYAEPIPNITRNGNSNKLETEFAKGLRNYAAEEYAAAITDFEKIGSASNRYDESVMLIIDCLVKQEQWAEAHLHVKNAMGEISFSDITRDKLEWTDILLHLRQNEEDIARDKLARLLDSPQHLFYKRAKSLSSEIKK